MHRVDRRRGNLRSTRTTGKLPRGSRGAVLAAAFAALPLLSCSDGAPASGEQTPGADEDRTRVVLLGTGTPNADPRRSGPSVAIIVDGRSYIVDAGPGIVRRAAAAAEQGIAALAPAALRTAFLTHLHTDHTVGLPDLIFTPWVLERDVPLQLIGPPGSEAMVAHLLAAFEEDVRIRLDGLEPANPSGHRVIVREVREGTVYDDGTVRVTAFPVLHGSWPVALGYRFDTPDRSIVISGDTRYTDAIVRACDGCDVLIHEVYSEVGFARRDSVWKEYHASFHTSSSELAALASQARPGLLILYHQLMWGTTPDELVAEVRRGWDGRVVFGEDLEVF